MVVAPPKIPNKQQKRVSAAYVSQDFKQTKKGLGRLSQDQGFPPSPKSSPRRGPAGLAPPPRSRTSGARPRHSPRPSVSALGGARFCPEVQQIVAFLVRFSSKAQTNKNVALGFGPKATLDWGSKGFKGLKGCFPAQLHLWRGGHVWT